MTATRKARYSARFAASDQDIAAAQTLRHQCFFGARETCSSRQNDRVDHDAFDAICRHVLIEEISTGALVCCFRLLPLRSGSEIGKSYSAQFYDLSALMDFDEPMAEVGRFCVHPDWKDPEIVRVAWAAMTRFVDDTGTELLFGCSSFRGTEAARHLDAFTLLSERHIAPGRWLPQVKAPRIFSFGKKLQRQSDVKLGMLRMPPLLRSYLIMGGWVSDHAVLDPELDTLHVFTGLEIKAIPPVRKRLLRGLAASSAFAH